MGRHRALQAVRADGDAVPRARSVRLPFGVVGDLPAPAHRHQEVRHQEKESGS